MIMRNKIYKFIIKASKHPEGTILPKWIVFCYFILFPMKYICWRTNTNEGYQIITDTWIIGGVKYSGAFFRFFSADERAKFRFVKLENGIITISRCDE